jgi:ribosomal protein S18 acetylase RimI-like enzyme
MTKNTIALIAPSSAPKTYSTPEETAIIDGLREFNRSRVGDSDFKSLVLAIKNENGEVVAGLVGHTARAWLFVEALWVHESLRGADVGTELLSFAETEAKNRGCKFAHLDTFGFQALGFYEKLGYEKFGTLENYPKGYSRYFLKKTF